MAQYLVEDLHLQRAAILNELGAGGTAYADSFSMRLKHLGGDIVWSEDLNSGTKDFKAFMSTASEKGAQAIFALGGVDDGICGAAAQMPPGMVFLGTDNFTDDPACVAQAGNAAEGMIGTFGDVVATNLPGARLVVAAYSKMFPRTNVAAHYIFAAYDSALILIDAIQYAVSGNNGELPSRAQVLAAIARTNAVYQGATGSYSFDPNGDAKVPMMSIYQVKAGKWTFVQRLDVTSD